ncbi:uncharacterized protein [Callorhinus ursinus]|uniref:uncharacterized protein n=1 Tax=Callorhinus ursinus TaxID=34884 RepID=UPI003CD0058F
MVATRLFEATGPPARQRVQGTCLGLGDRPTPGDLRTKPAPAGSAPQPGTPQRLVPGRPGQTSLLRPATHEALPARPPSAPRPEQVLTKGLAGEAAPTGRGALRGRTRARCGASPLAAGLPALLPGTGPGPRAAEVCAPGSLAAPRVHGAPASRPRAGPRPEPPPLAASPRSAFTALGPGPPLGRFRFRFPASLVEENESDRGRGPGPRSSRRREGRGERRRSAWSLRAGAAARTRGGGSTPWTSLPGKAVPRLDRRETRKWTPGCSRQRARIHSLLEGDSIKTDATSFHQTPPGKKHITTACGCTSSAHARDLLTSARMDLFPPWSLTPPGCKVPFAADQSRSPPPKKLNQWLSVLAGHCRHQGY